MGFFQKIIDDFGLGQHKVDEEALYAQIALFKDDLKAQEGKYTNQDEAIQFRDKWADLYKEAKAARLGKKSPLWEERKQFTDTFDRLAEVLTGYNSAVIAAESKRCDALLSDIDGKNLDPQQRAVVLCNEKRMLVLAGAGSGKTLTIAGKVKYLCQEKGVSPEDILLIAFTHKSAEEMTDRISGKLGIPVSATTFHKLGLDLIREAEGKRPDVYEGLTDFCRDYFQNVITTQAGQVRCIIEFFAYYLHIPADMEQFSSLGEAYDYEKSVDLETLRSKYDQAKWIGKKEQSKKEQHRTLQDERVRSLEEVSIANFLFLNGVQYEYERPYPFPDNDPDRKPYHPDFYLPEYDIYLEHFGINREGKIPWLSAVEEEKYQEGMAWKRQVHKKNGTKLLETYSYLSSEGRLLEYLDSLLKKNGVKYKEPDFTDIFESVYTVKEVRPRYSCFYKIRHPGDCDGQSGYGVSKLDSIVEEVVRQIFAQFREVSRKKLLESVKTNDAARIQKKVKKIQKDLESKQKELDDLKAETILVIRGVSALDKELLGTLVAEAREALGTLEKQLVQAQEEYEEATKTAKRSNYICNELFTWADVYDTANHDERRAILQQFIKEIRVRKDYEISITLNASFNQVEQLKSVSTYDGAEIFEEISEKGA